MIVAGEPNAFDKLPGDMVECFPEALRYRLNDDGSMSVIRTEPIAADVREGKDGRRNAFIKIVAGITGIGFDLFIQRDKQRRRRQAILASFISVLFFTIISGLAAYSYVQWGKGQRAEQTIRKNAAKTFFYIACEKIEQDRPDTALAYLDYALNLDAEFITARVRMFTLLNQCPWVRLVSKVKHEKPVTSAKFSPDSRWVVSTSGVNTVCVYEAATAKPVGEQMKHDDKINSAAFSPDGRWVVTASDDKTTRIWEAATGKLVIEPMRHYGKVNSAAFSPDGHFLLTISEDMTPLSNGKGLALLWEIAIDESVKKHKPIGFDVTSAEFSPDSCWILTTIYDIREIVWDVAKGNIVSSFMNHQYYDITSAKFSPDGRWVVTSSFDKTAQVWDAATGKPVSDLMRHDGTVNSAEFSPDGRWIVTASLDKTAQVWDAKTGISLNQPLKHEDEVWSAKFSPDGRWVVTASKDKTARIWEVATSKPVSVPIQHEDFVQSAEFSPDGRWLMTLSGGVARFWHFLNFDYSSQKMDVKPLRLLAKHLSGYEIDENLHVKKISSKQCFEITEKLMLHQNHPIWGELIRHYTNPMEE